MKRGNTEVETLHLNGWGIGDILEGTFTCFEGDIITNRIKIITLGEEMFICRWDRLDGKGYREENGSTALTHMEWKKIGEDKVLKRRATFWSRLFIVANKKIKTLKEELKVQENLSESIVHTNEKPTTPEPTDRGME